MPTVLIVESNTPEMSANIEARGAKPMAEGYGDVLQALRDDLEIRIVRPYAGEALPSLDGIDGVVFTGSAVDWNTDDDRAAPLAEAMKRVFARGLPTLGSCNGMQLAASVLGGSSQASPNGREDGIARDIQLTDDGKSHPMMAGRKNGYAVPCVHRDEVVTLPEGAILLSGNGHSGVQAFAYERDGVKFWGMQYHPEFTPAFLGTYMKTREDPDARALGDDLLAAATDAQAAARLGTTPQDQALETRTLELRNWLNTL